MAIDKTKNVRKLITLPHEMMRRVEDVRFEQRINSETEAFRQIIDAGLKVLEKKPKKKS